jgi:redox-sensitive bicupin YhaK (pirin superfamily)
MITIRPAGERGHANFDWLDTHHTFSFGQYYDANHMGFGPLRVINDDRVKPGKGFAPHAHNDMEIVTYVLEGALEHKDSLGNGSIIRPGEVQRMSAGTGIRHSEYNPSVSEEVHLLQIWIIPEKEGLAPGYEQKHFGDERKGRLCLIASPNAREGSLTIHRDADVYAAILEEGEKVSHTIRPSRKIWAQIADGSIILNGKVLGPGDGAALNGETDVRVEATSPAEILLFDMA